MSKFWGVNCKDCDEFIKLGDQSEEPITVYLPSFANETIVCGECGGSYVYGSRAVVDEDGVALNNWVPANT